MQIKNTSSFISILAISLLLLFPNAGNAQRRKPVTTVVKDTVPLFRGISVGVDVVGAAMAVMSDYGQYEGVAVVNLKDKYFPTIEIGIGNADKKDDITGTTFTTRAPYFRIGTDFNVMKNKHDIYRVIVGARAAYTSFSYDFGNPNVKDPIWGGPVDYSVSNVPCNFLWAELVGGVNAKILGPIHLGWTVRYRARLYAKSSPYGAPWYVPGYGLNSTSRLGIVFNICLDF